MSQKSFLAIEKAFCLPKPTLHEAFLGNGMFSKHMEYHLESPTKIGEFIQQHLDSHLHRQPLEAPFQLKTT